MAGYTDSVYVASVIVTSLYGNLQGQGLWCNGNCNEFVWQLTGTQAIYNRFRARRVDVCQSHN